MGGVKRIINEIKAVRKKLDETIPDMIRRGHKEVMTHHSNSFDGIISAPIASQIHLEQLQLYFCIWSPHCINILSGPLQL